MKYVRPDDTLTAVELVAHNPGAAYLAGGTTQLDLTIKDAVVTPDLLVDVTRLPLRETMVDSQSLTVGALVTMEELAAHPAIAERAPFVREALLAGASTQLRNMATIGGNLLQRTRCRYFRDATVHECNKRVPGSGCAAYAKEARMHAILGASEHCIALHASDLCVPLVALDAHIRLQAAHGERTIPLKDLYLLPGKTPERETVLEHGELITHVVIPLLPSGTHSGYLKVRDRASYEFALCSAAVAIVTSGDTISQARVALGGVGTVPWRAPGQRRLLSAAVLAMKPSAPPPKPPLSTRSSYPEPHSRSSSPSAP
jgi:xanthine dehydrogenase YagS FAD-binding subunit